jgi:hypothetical protein
MYKFRAKSSSSSGGQIVLTQHLVSSFTDSENTRCCINTIWPPEDEQDIARNLYILIYVLKVKWNKVKYSEVKWSEVKWSEVKWSELKWSKVKWSEMKWIEVK